MSSHTLKSRVADLWRHLSAREGDAARNDEPPAVSESFIHKYLNGDDKHAQPEILHGKSCYDLPSYEIAYMSPRTVATHTGPSGGLTRVVPMASSNPQSRPPNMEDNGIDFIDDSPKKSNANLNDNNSTEPEIAGIQNWDCPAEYAMGLATTLYECNPLTKENTGEPIADAFGICVRENSAILALADGVNWGKKSCLAAQCAIHGCIDYLNKALFGSHVISSTLDVFVCLLRSFEAAHNLILEKDGQLTTLCAAAICPLKDGKYAVCVCNVGDSFAYVFNKQYGVREITFGSHDIYSMRDMRDALGALGPVDGKNPELNNLTVSLTVAEDDDIVFLTSDGISDNFDPVVGKFALAKKTSGPGSGEERSHRQANSVKRSSSHRIASTERSSLPVVEAHQRHALTLLRMEDLLRNGVSAGEEPVESAGQLCDRMVQFATRLTTAKRRILEDPELYKDEQCTQKERRQRVCQKLALVPGKLDHASLVAVQLGLRSGPRRSIAEARKAFFEANNNTPRSSKKGSPSKSRKNSSSLCNFESTI